MDDAWMNNYMQTDWMMAMDWKNKQKIKWMDGWIHEQTNKPTNERMNKEMDEWIGALMFANEHFKVGMLQ